MIMAPTSHPKALPYESHPSGALRRIIEIYRDGRAGHARPLHDGSVACRMSSQATPAASPPRHLKDHERRSPLVERCVT